MKVVDEDGGNRWVKNGDLIELLGRREASESSDAAGATEEEN